MSRNRSLTYSVLAVAMLIFIHVSPAISANLNVTPSLSLSEYWDSNILVTRGNEESDYISRANAGLVFSLGAFHTTTNIGGNIELNRYAKHHELNNTSNAITRNFNISVDQSKPLLITPNFSITPAVRYVETHDLVRRNQLTQSPVEGLPPSETFVTSRIGVREYGGSIALHYLFTPRIAFDVGGAGYRRIFLEGPPELVDSKIFVVHTALSYAITHRLSSGIFFDVSDDRFDNGNITKTYTPGWYGLYRLTENHNVSLGVGATNTKYYTLNGSSTNMGWSPYGNLTLSYAWKTFAASLFGSYQIAGGGSFGSAEKRSNIVLALSDRFTERWSWTLSGSYQRNSSFGNPAAPFDHIDTALGAGQLSYAVTDWASLQLSGNTFRQWVPGISDSDLRRESVLLGVSIGKAYNIF